MQSNIYSFKIFPRFDACKELMWLVACRLSLKNQILNRHICLLVSRHAAIYNRKSKVVFQIPERKQHIIQQKYSFGFPCQWLYMDFDLPFLIKRTVWRDRIQIFWQKWIVLGKNKDLSWFFKCSKCSSDEMSSLPFSTLLRWKHIGELTFLIFNWRYILVVSN